MDSHIPYILWILLLSPFISQLYTDALITIMVDSDQKDIKGRAGCNYERTCCTDDAGAALNWFGSGGGLPLGNSSNIFVTNSQVGGRRCTTIAFRPATVGSQEYTCFGMSGNNFVSLNFRITIPPGSKPRSIQVDGDTQKNITGRNVGEPVTVGCTVDSCLTSPYRIRFAYPNDTEISNRFFNAMMHTDTTTITLGMDNSGLYKCEVTDATNGAVLDTATFEFVGTVGMNPPTPTITIATPMPPTCPSTVGRDAALGVVFSLVGIAIIVAVVVVVVVVLYKFTSVCDPLKQKLSGKVHLKEEESPERSGTRSS